MDKYTVDLDKVLNDFEYSEYSLESAKLSKNVHNENQTTSVNTNLSSKNDTSVKHSINNVFHSLNEYLSSDITPKKIENVNRNFKSIDNSNEKQSSSFSVNNQSIAFQQTDETLRFSLLPAISNDVQTISKDKVEFANECNIKLENLEDDNYGDTCAIKLNSEETFQEHNEINSIDEGSAVIKNLDNKCLSIQIPDHDSSLIENSVMNKTVLDTSRNSNDECDEILVDFTRIDFCDTTNSKIEETTHINGGENQEHSIEIRKESEVDDKTDLQALKNEEEIDAKKDEREINSILQEESIENNEQQDLPEDNSKSEITEITVEKIGFNHDVEIDEENIEQYFQELEEELRIEDEDLNIGDAKISFKISDIDVGSNEITSNSATEDNSPIVKSEINEPDGLVSNENSKELLLESESDQKSNSLDFQKNSEPVNIEKKILQDSEMDAEVSIDSENGIGNQNEISNEETNMNPNDQPNDTENQTLVDSQEFVKNSRPQILPLSDDVQESLRKIDLIGEPGSTPYNNLYSAKSFTDSLGERTEDQTSKRPISPSYSDVSTDSVSSGSSEDTTEYNDAVSEAVKQENSEKFSEEMTQNNLIQQPVDTSKNDITMDKDFKNNLKMSNEMSGKEPSTSCSRFDEIGGVSETQELEGACAVNTDGSGEPIEENVQMEEGRIEITDSSTTSAMEWLGKQAPLWIPDSEAMSCLHCDMKFTLIKRRHHCRACGLVLCSKCCNLKYRLEYLNAEERVCMKCFEILDRDTNSNSGSEFSQESSSPSRNLNSSNDNLGQPNPNNPLEYCSKIPPTQQVDAGAMAVPSVMVPVGVLKRKGSNKGRSNKSVMFCDGIRPGSDLTNLDTDFNYSENQKSEKQRKLSVKTAPKTGKNQDMMDPITKSFIPSDEGNLPPTVTIFKTDIKYSPCANNSSVVEMLKSESLTFALQPNVFVHLKIINMDCCISRTAWCFSSEGLINVGQDEIVVLLEFSENESLVPKDIFVHLNHVYLEAVKGCSVKELSMSLHPNSPLLGSKNHSGFIYIRPTFQCLQNVILPKEPYLFGILIHRWETPWAKLFPLRLVLRLGAEYKYYPSPIISTRNRDSVFVEIGHTIINLLADFRNFSYTIPQIRGLTIHMEDKNTTVTIPGNRYDQVLKSLSNSSDHILAFAGNFSSVADSHLVCIQDTQSATNGYSTHAINICNQPRKVTGASFIVFNGALKSTSGLTAKSNIVEDGLMIQILPEHMLQVRDSLKNMRGHTIKCGCVNEESDETVTIVWGEPDTSFNVGVLSPIDNKILTGIPSIRVHNGKDYTCNSGTRLIRWTEVFISQGDDSSKNQESIDIRKISENISKATCQALVKYLDLLVSNSFYKIGLRTNIHVENVSYSAGSNNVKLPPIYMKSLDNELIPVLHRIASNSVSEQPIVLELIFRILNV